MMDGRRISLTWPAVYASKVGSMMLSDGRFPVNICNAIYIFAKDQVSWCIQISHSLNIHSNSGILINLDSFRTVAKDRTLRLTLCGSNSSGIPSFRASSRVCTWALPGITWVIKRLLRCLWNIKKGLLCNDSCSIYIAERNIDKEKMCHGATFPYASASG